jgi:alpha-ketoglutaric semialdehyde dehydrogenase
MLHNYIGGQWEAAGATQAIPVTNPATGEVLAKAPLSSATDVGKAVAAAAAALPAWRRTPAGDRIQPLFRLKALLDANYTEIARLITQECGKTLAESEGELKRGIENVEVASGIPSLMMGANLEDIASGIDELMIRQPVGVVGVITPFNFPIAIPAWKLAPALVYGNTVVWKPASTVPLLAIRLAQALSDAGLPAGVLNLLIGGSDIGDAIVGHRDIDAITFTGSTAIGRGIAATAAARGVPAQAEMGGKNAAVVLDDADLDLALDQVMLGAFRSTGQKCTATSRLIITDGIADRFLSALTDRARALVVGDPTDDATQMGPVVNESALKSISAGIDTAAAQGATVLAGGKPYTDGPLAAGYFIAPTVVELSDGPADIWTDELFGPVLAVKRAADADEAFVLANDSEFGLSAAVFTQDLTRALQAVEHIDVGVLHVNSESAGADPHVPFGGAKKSGLGPKEQGGAAREFFTHTTTVYLRGGRPGA